MNAKKIMGAVLVALLAAALFVGAGAAGTLNDLDGKTVYVYQDMSNYPVANTVWYNTAGESVTFNAQSVIEQKDVKEGKYSYNDTISITVTKPTVKITATGVNGDKTYPVTGGNFYYGEDVVLTFNILSPAGGQIADILVTKPSGEEVLLSKLLNETGGIDTSTIEAYITTTFGQGGVFSLNEASDGSGDYDKTILNAMFGNVTAGEAKTGLYKFQGVFSSALGTAGNLTAATPENLLIGQDVLSFKVVLSTETSISASVDTVVDGSTVVVTMTGVPGKTYNLTTDGYFEPIATGLTAFTQWNTGDYSFKMPNTGEIQITLKAVKVGDATLTLVDGSDEKTVEIEVVEGTITAEADAESYFIGNDVKLAGTNTVGNDNLKFYIKGTNFEFQPIADSYVKDYDAENGEWSATIMGSYFTAKNPDAGTYTIFITNNQTDGLTQEQVEDSTYVTVAVALKQPFISVTEAPAVVVKGSDAVIKGTAEAAKKIGVYIFGTNKFLYTNASTDDVKIELKDSLFTITIKKAFTNSIDAGQYFAVVQHPMYDGELNVWAQNTNITTAETKNGVLQAGKVLFDVADRQKANAAEALCQAIDSENIDDMYVKLSFVVAGPQSIINPIPETVAQGEKLTISGTTNLGKGEVVTVEMLSTAFAAVPKATVGSASFISLVTKTDENGNWEVTFDTTGLNVDEYTVTAAVGSLDATTAKINVVEGAPETPDTPDTPDVPDTPDTPTEPETPGFGALAALAGLGAVAVLLLRRE